MTPTYKPEQLVVTRDGCLDDEYYDSVYADRRREAGRAVIRNMLSVPLTVGRNILSLLSEYSEQAK